MDQTIPQGGWWSRNWKWFVPVGCLSILATCGCCIGGSVLFSVNAVKNSRSYTEAIRLAKEDPDVKAALGTPIEAGWMTQFSANASAGETKTAIRIPLSGPKGEGALFVKGLERDKEVVFHQLDFVMGQKVVHLPGVVPEERSAPGSPESPDVDLDKPELTVESGADRPGADYRDYEMTDADASKCALDCSGDEQCRAYTFVKPSDGKPGRCRLKNKASAKVASDCCVSGVKK